MRGWGFYFDQTRCIGCKTCTVACMAWNESKRGDAVLYPEHEIQTNPAYEIPAGYETMPDGSFNRTEMSKYHMKEELIRVTEAEYGRGMPDVDVLYLALACGHCERPACVAACPRGCIAKDAETGAVLTVNNSTVSNGTINNGTVNNSATKDGAANNGTFSGSAENVSAALNSAVTSGAYKEICVGCGVCRSACPFGAPQFYKDPAEAAPGETVPMVKCDLCVERIRAGLKPACVAACRVRALDALPMDALAARYPNAVAGAANLPGDISPLTREHTHPNWLFKPKAPRHAT